MFSSTVNNSCTSCSSVQLCCRSCSAPPAPIPSVPVGAGWELAELMSCPVPGCPQGLTRNQPCPGLREHRYEILNKQIIPAGSLDRARHAPGAEQPWVHQTLRWCLGSPRLAGRALTEQRGGSAGAIPSLSSLAHRFTFRALTAQPQRPGQLGAGAMTLIYLPQPSPACSAPQPAAAQPSSSCFCSARGLCGAAEPSRVGSAHTPAQEAARGSGIPPAAPKGARAVPERAVPCAHLPSQAGLPPPG